MTGTAILVIRIGSALAALGAALWLFWAVAWRNAGFGLLTALLAGIAAALWRAGTTPEARDRRRLIISSAVATVGIVVVGAFLAVGSG